MYKIRSERYKLNSLLWIVIMQMYSTENIRNWHRHLNERTVTVVGIYEPV